MTPLLAALLFVQAPTVVHLWPNGAPGFENRKDEPEIVKNGSVTNVHNPSITVFLPPREKANGTAVVIVPGGGHSALGFNGEGVAPAKMLNDLGVACFVLKHRLAREAGSPYKIEVHARQDMERAVRLVRSCAGEWGVDPKRVGALGFSAGGETAAFVSYADLKGDPAAVDPIDRLDARADFFVSVYPGPIGYPAAVPSDAPPAFMVCSYDDEFHAKVLEDMIPRYRAAKVPLEIHLLAVGGHGFGMAMGSKFQSVKGWTGEMVAWMNDRGLLTKAP